MHIENDEKFMGQSQIEKNDMALCTAEALKNRIFKANGLVDKAHGDCWEICRYTAQCDVAREGVILKSGRCGGD